MIELENLKYYEGQHHRRPFHYCHQTSESNSSHNSMPWPFCPSCHATLHVNSGGSVYCDICPYQTNLSKLKKLPESITYSSNSAASVPFWAKSDAEQAALQQSTTDATANRATIDEPCIQCGHPQVGYYTVQLRSVDEGQTVFYECPNCKHNWSVNN